MTGHTWLSYHGETEAREKTAKGSTAAIMNAFPADLFQHNSAMEARAKRGKRGNDGAKQHLEVIVENGDDLVGDVRIFKPTRDARAYTSRTIFSLIWLMRLLAAPLVMLSACCRRDAA